jgi:hypothetical protein
MIDAAFVALVLVDCIWLSAAAVAAPGLVVDPLDAAFAVVPLNGSADWALAEPEAVLLAGVMLDSVWLIEMSWSNWFSDTNCPTIAVGSTGAVGSWFCNSVTSKFRKVSWRLVDESPVGAVEVLLDVFAEPVTAFALADVTGPVIAGVNPCMFIDRSSLELLFS